MLFTPAEIERLGHLDPDDPELLSAIDRLYEAHDFVGQVALRKSLLAAARDALLKAAEEIREVLEGNHIKPAEDGIWIPSGIFSNLKRWGLLPLTVLAALREAPHEIARHRDDRGKKTRNAEEVTGQ